MTRGPKPPLRLPDDGLVDELAVRIAVSGCRVVRLTPTGCDLAAREMITRGADLHELVSHLGISYADGGRLIRSLGYRLSTPSGGASKHRWIVPADLAAAA